MSMYGMMMGSSPFAAGLLAVLGFTDPQQQIPRLRDVYISTEGDIVVLTRTGGGNRSSYVAENAALEAVPGFKRTEDWDLDTTYAKWVYAVPAEHAELVQQLAALGAVSDPTEKFNQLMAALNGPDSPAKAAALERAAPLRAQITAALGGGGPQVIMVDGSASQEFELPRED